MVISKRSALRRVDMTTWPHRDSNSGFCRERAASLASRRWGRHIGRYRRGEFNFVEWRHRLCHALRAQPSPNIPGQGFEPRFYGPEPHVLPVGRPRSHLA